MYFTFLLLMYYYKYVYTVLIKNYQQITPGRKPCARRIVLFLLLLLFFFQTQSLFFLLPPHQFLLCRWEGFIIAILQYSTAIKQLRNL